MPDASAGERGDVIERRREREIARKARERELLWSEMGNRNKAIHKRFADYQAMGKGAWKQPGIPFSQHDIEYIRMFQGAGITMGEIAKVFRVSYYTIRDICSFKTYQHVMPNVPDLSIDQVDNEQKATEDDGSVNEGEMYFWDDKDKTIVNDNYSMTFATKIASFDDAKAWLINYCTPLNEGFSLWPSSSDPKVMKAHPEFVWMPPGAQAASGPANPGAESATEPQQGSVNSP